MGQLWWARIRVAEFMKPYETPPKAYPDIDASILGGLIDAWERCPWYGTWDEGWCPRPFYHALLRRMMDGSDLGNDPAAWRAWLQTHPKALYARGPRRLVWRAEELLPYLRDPRPEIRAETAVLLGVEELEGGPAAPAVAGLLDDPDPQVRANTVWALCRLDGKTYVSRFSTLLHDEDATVRLSALHALSRSGTADQAHAVAGFLGDPDPRMRCCAVEAARKCGAGFATPTIAALLDDPDPDVRNASLAALRKLSGQPWKGDDGIAAAKAWWAAHKHDPEFAPAPPAP